MPWKNVVYLCVMAIGVILFLYGSNYYDAITGLAGVFLLIIDFFTLLTLKVHKKLKRVRIS